MGLESATYVSQLVSTNPATSDLEAQGANHLQLIKSVLQNTFPGASYAYQIPLTASKSANYVSVIGDINTLFLINTGSGAITFTLPATGSLPTPWEISLMKTTTDTNPILIAPATGSLQSGEVSVAQARRCIPFRRFRVLWTGSNWVVERVPAVPVGSIITFQGASLPVGYEWPSGQTLSSASTNYPEYYSINGNSGVTPDLRGRASFGKDNMGGSAANRITVAGGNFDGTVLDGTGGGQNNTLVTNNIPQFTFTPSGSLTNPIITVANPYNQGIFGSGAKNGISVVTANNGNEFVDFNSPAQWTASAPVFTGNAITIGAASPASISSIPPAIIMNKLLVTE